MRVIDAVQYINPDEINAPYMESLAQKLRNVGGVISRSPKMYIYIYVYVYIYIYRYVDIGICKQTWGNGKEHGDYDHGQANVKEHGKQNGSRGDIEKLRVIQRYFLYQHPLRKFSQPAR